VDRRPGEGSLHGEGNGEGGLLRCPAQYFDPCGRGHGCCGSVSPGSPAFGAREGRRIAHAGGGARRQRPTASAARRSKAPGLPEDRGAAAAMAAAEGWSTGGTPKQAAFAVALTMQGTSPGLDPLGRPGRDASYRNATGSAMALAGIEMALAGIEFPSFDEVIDTMGEMGEDGAAIGKPPVGSRRDAYGTETAKERLVQPQGEEELT